MKTLILYSHQQSGWSMVKFSMMVRKALEGGNTFLHLIPTSRFSKNIRNKKLKSLAIFVEKKVFFPIQILIFVLIFRPDRLLFCDHSDVHLRLLVPFKKSLVFCHDLFAVKAMLNRDEASRQTRRIRFELKLNLNFLRRTERFIAVSESTKKSIHQLISNANVVVISPTVLHLNLPTVSQDAQMPYCLLPMNQHWRKDRLMGIKVFCEISNRTYPELELVIVGNSLTDFEKDYLGKNNGLSRTVVLNGVSEMEMQALYKDCEFVIFTSKLEGFGLPLIEANSFSRLAIYSDIEALREVGKNINFCLDDKIENVDWAKVVEFVQNQQNREKAYKHFEENFSFKIFQNRLSAELKR